MSLRSHQSSMFEVDITHHVDGIMSVTTKSLCFLFKWATMSYIPDSLEFPVSNNFIPKMMVTLYQVKSDRVYNIKKNILKITIL